jgi:hypothetical protein
MQKTTISWATHSLNVVHGCSKPAVIPQTEAVLQYVDYPYEHRWTLPGSSPECAQCYAEKESNKKARISEKRWGHHKGWTIAAVA